jgi:c-di-GMP-binding flagellar brake protein YcgR
MGFQSEEKRRFTRIKFKSPVRYQVRGRPEFENAVSDNISAGGIGFINNRFLAPSTLVMLEINVLSRIVRPIGRIASSLSLSHSARNRLGIEFLEINNSEKHYLQDFIDMQLAR